ncbi:MAG: IS3 family transposase [Deltaproteobacteria bacterium]|nr:IS3 family transposase [Deltaproteobacteria bacterium]
MCGFYYICHHRFFRSLKSERLSDYRFTTRQAARMEVLDYILYYT